MSRQTFAITQQTFKSQVLDSTTPVLIEFTAEWCPPCKMLAPIIHQIASRYEGRLSVGMVDNDSNPEIIYQYGIMGLPTLLLFVNGEPVERIIGFTPRERIEARILPHLAAENA